MEHSQLDKITVPLLEWYHAGNRQLPWRENKDPYRVWVSEIMLQQTRVETVIPYYERFMERFPTVGLLAACNDEELFKLWEGLGYYSRARNLKKAAQVICTQYQGQFPEQFEEILALPGIGTYTAGAISSIAFDKAKAAVDGNVLRVITRLTQDSQDIMDAKFRRQVTEELEKIYPPQMRGDFTQSLMELGAVICVPNGEPLCAKCSLNSLCGAYKSGTQLQYPVKKKKAARRIEKKTILLLRCKDKIAIRKRSETGILSGMWELPNIDGNLTRQQINAWLADSGLFVKAVRETAGSNRPLKHIFTHIEWHMTRWTVDCENEGNDNCFTWVTSGQLEGEIALPTAFKKCLKEKKH
ncbi:MAG: A/G-specific adenine glycosylase [Lachnospiraceae bacterium]|nr:A/G-specific adenine glycosylase [Lachnospiraceae bacterium]